MDRPLISRLFRLLVGLLGLALLIGVAAVVRWRELDWGSWIWVVGLFAMLAIRTPYALRSRGNVIIDSRSDRTDRLLLAGMAVGAFVLPLIFLATPFLRFADYDLPDWATMVGSAVILAALWLLWRSHADLGRNWSPGVEVRRDHELVTSGVYARIRHPMYAGLGLWIIAQPLLLHNWIAGVLAISAGAALYFVRVPREEAMMRDRFGGVWDAYTDHTGRLLPKRRRRR